MTPFTWDEAPSLSARKWNKTSDSYFTLMLLPGLDENIGYSDVSYSWLCLVKKQWYGKEVKTQVPRVPWAYRIRFSVLHTTPSPGMSPVLHVVVYAHPWSGLEEVLLIWKCSPTRPHPPLISPRANMDARYPLDRNIIGQRQSGNSMYRIRVWEIITKTKFKDNTGNQPDHFGWKEERFWELTH